MANTVALERSPAQRDMAGSATATPARERRTISIFGQLDSENQSSATDLRLDPTSRYLWVGTKSGGILAYSLLAGGRTIVPHAPFFSSVAN